VIEPQLRAELERARARGQWALHELFTRVPTALVNPPPELASGWRSCNTPAEWRELTGEEPRELPE
jgi:hypothetical protein